MPSSTNQLTIVLGIADNKLRAGVKRAQAHLMGLERSLNKTGAAGTRAGAQINAGAKVAKNGIGDARKGMARFTESVRTSIVNMKFLAGLLAGGALTKGIVSFSSTYEKSIASLNTLLVKSSVSAQEYSNQLKGLAASTPKDLIDLSSALYQIISAGVPAVNKAGGAFDVLTKSTKLAVSSLSETKQAANLLITTMNAYRGTTLSTGQATDKLTRIYQLGRTTVGELSTSFGRAATIASQFGVSMDETGAMLISLTRAGLNTNESITATRAIMSGMAKPTKKTQKILKSLGVEFGQGAIEAHGFTGVLEQLMNATGGNVDVLARLFPNIRALLPAVVTVGAGFDEFKGHVNELKNSFGATDDAVEKTDQKFFKSAALLKSNFQNVLVEMGEGILPVLMDKFDRLSEYLQSSEGQEFAETLSSLLVQMVELTAVFAKAIGAGIKPFIEIFEKFGGVIATGLKVAVLSKALLMLQATFTSFATRMTAIGAAAGAGAGNAFGAGILTRAGVAINGLFARMSPRLLAAGTKMGAFIGRGISTGIAAANIGMAVLKSLLGIGGIVFMISALVSTFFGEAEEEAREQARQTKKDVAAEIEELKKQRARAYKERTGVTKEEMTDLQQRKVSGTVVELSKEERMRSISAEGFEGSFDLGSIKPGMKSGEALMEAKEVYQGLVRQFTRLLPEGERQTKEGLRKAQDAAFKEWEKILKSRIDESTGTLRSFVTEGRGKPETLQAELKEGLDEFGGAYFKLITDVSGSINKKSGDVLAKEGARIIGLAEMDKMRSDAFAQEDFDNIRKEMLIKARQAGVQDTVFESAGYKVRRYNPKLEKQELVDMPMGTRLPRGTLTPESLFSQEDPWRGLFFTKEELRAAPTGRREIDRISDWDRQQRQRTGFRENDPAGMWELGRRSVEEMLGSTIERQIQDDLDGTFQTYLNFISNLALTEGETTERGRDALAWMREYKDKYVEAQINTVGAVADSQRLVFDEGTQAALVEFNALVESFKPGEGTAARSFNAETLKELQAISHRITDATVKRQVDDLITALVQVESETKAFAADPQQVARDIVQQSQNRDIPEFAGKAVEGLVNRLTTEALGGDAPSTVSAIGVQEARFEQQRAIATRGENFESGLSAQTFGDPEVAARALFGDARYFYGFSRQFEGLGDKAQTALQEFRKELEGVDFEKPRDQTVEQIKGLSSYLKLVETLSETPVFSEKAMGKPEDFIANLQRGSEHLKGLQDQIDALTLRPIKLDKNVTRYSGEAVQVYGTVQEGDAEPVRMTKQPSFEDAQDQIESGEIVAIGSLLDTSPGTGFAPPGTRENAPAWMFEDFELPKNLIGTPEGFDPASRELMRKQFEAAEEIIAELRDGSITNASKLEEMLEDLADITVPDTGQDLPNWLQAYSNYLAEQFRVKTEVEKLGDDNEIVQGIAAQQAELKAFADRLKTVTANLNVALTDTPDFRRYQQVNDQIEKSRSKVAAVVKLEELRNDKAKDFIGIAQSVLGVMSAQNIEGGKSVRDANTRLRLLQGIIDRQKKSNQAARKLPKDKGRKGRDYTRAFNKAVERLIDKTEKTRIKNNITLAQLDVARNKSIQKRIGLTRKELMVGRSWYGEQKKLLSEVLETYDEERRAIEASVDAERGLYEARRQAASDQFDREMKSERKRLERVFRGNAARGRRGAANRRKMEDALDKFSEQRARKRDAALSKLDDKYEQTSEARIRKLKAIDRSVAQTRQKQLQGILKEIVDANRMIQEQLNLAFKRSDQADSLGKFLEVQREILRLSVESTENLKEQIRLKQRQASEEIKQGSRLLQLQKDLEMALLVRKETSALVSAVGIKDGVGYGEADAEILEDAKQAEAKVAELRSDIVKEEDRIRSGESFRRTQRDIESLRRQSEDSEKQMQDKTRRRVVSFLASMKDGSDIVSSRIEGGYAEATRTAREAAFGFELLGDRLESLPLHTRKALEDLGLITSESKRMIDLASGGVLSERGGIIQPLFGATARFGQGVGDAASAIRIKGFLEATKEGGLNLFDAMKSGSVEVLSSFKAAPLEMLRAADVFALEFASKLGGLSVGELGFVTDSALAWAQRSTKFLTDSMDFVGSRLGTTIGKRFGEVTGEAGSLIGHEAGTAFGLVAGSLMQAALQSVSRFVISPIQAAIGRPFSILSDGFSEAFSAIGSEAGFDEEVFNKRMESIQREHDLRLDHITDEADKSAAQIDKELSKTSDLSKIKELTAKREEVRAKRDEDLLEARRAAAEKENALLMERKEQEKKSPENIIDEYIEKALELVNTLVETLPGMAVKAVKVLTSKLPGLIIGAATALGETLSSIAPLMGDMILSVIKSLIDALPLLLKGAGEFVVGLVEGVIDGFVEILGSFDQIAGPFIEAVVRGTPKIIGALIRAIPKLIGATIKMIPMLLVEVAKGLGLLIKGIFVDAGEALLEVVSLGIYSSDGDSSVVGSALGGAALGAGVTAGLGYVSTFGAAAALTSGLGLAIMAGGALLGGIGSALDWWHKGGNIKEGNRNPIGARFLAGLGARGYATGGLVDGIQNSINGSRLRALRRGVDDVPAVLQAGEAVLNRQAVMNLGEETITALNSGQTIESGPTNVNVSINPDAGGLSRVVSQLLPHLISGVNAEVDRPGSRMRVENMRVGNRPMGTLSPKRG